MISNAVVRFGADLIVDTNAVVAPRGSTFLVIFLKCRLCKLPLLMSLDGSQRSSRAST